MTLRCRLFGHDFRTKSDEGQYTIIRPSEWCRNCGMTKEEYYKKRKK